MSWLKKLFAGLGVGEAARPDDEQARQAFKKLYARELAQALGTEVSVQWSDRLQDEVFLLDYGEITSLQLSVHNRFLHYCKAPGELQELLKVDVATVQNTAAQMGKGAAGADDAQSQRQAIFPVIKNQQWGVPVETDAQDAEAVGGGIRIPLSGDLMLTFVIDSEYAMRYVERSDLQALEIADEDELFMLAHENFAAYAQTGTHIEALGSGIFRVRLDEVYDASLMLFLDQILSQSALPLPQGDVVFALPARSAFLLCAATDARAVQTLRAYTTRLASEEPHAISERLYLRTREGMTREYLG